MHRTFLIVCMKLQQFKSFELTAKIFFEKPCAGIFGETALCWKFYNKMYLVFLIFYMKLQNNQISKLDKIILIKFLFWSFWGGQKGP